MYNFHKEKLKYFNWMHEIARDWIMPFIEEVKPLPTNAKVLEIGCAEAGVLFAFVERDFDCVGIELSETSVVRGRAFLAEKAPGKQVEIVSSNIYDIKPTAENGFQFDCIILKDVIEHIFDQEKFLAHLKPFLKPGGKVFFGFPPWQMPFGGHQQICRAKLLKVLPYFHLLPAPLYKLVLKLGRELPNRLNELMEIKETGLSIEAFNGMLKRQNYQVDNYKPFLINPIYSKKFGLKPRKQFGLIAALPFIRNFFTTAVYYVVSIADEKE